MFYSLDRDVAVGDYRSCPTSYPVKKRKKRFDVLSFPRGTHAHSVTNIVGCLHKHLMLPVYIHKESQRSINVLLAAVSLVLREKQC